MKQSECTILSHFKMFLQTLTFDFSNHKFCCHFQAIPLCCVFSVHWLISIHRKNNHLSFLCFYFFGWHTFKLLYFTVTRTIGRSSFRNKSKWLLLRTQFVKAEIHKCVAGLLSSPRVPNARSIRIRPYRNEGRHW